MAKLRILCLSDLHGRIHKAPVHHTRRDTDLPDADIVLIAGDLTNMGYDPRDQYGADVLESVAFWSTRLGERYGAENVFWVPGNHDIRVTDRDLPGATCALNTIKAPESPHSDVTIQGSALCTAFDAPALAIGWAHTTADRAMDMRHWEDLFAQAAYAGNPTIVLSHCPPYGILDAAGRREPKRNIGSPGLTDYIQRVMPSLVVCGHVHEARGLQIVETLRGPCVVVNCAETIALLSAQTRLEYPETRLESIAVESWRRF
jgi:Icc-related predicted phosphoesterase